MLKIGHYAGMLIILLTVSCVTEFQPEAVSIPPSLVVEGQVTDQPGPYTIKLTRTANYSFKSLNLLETGATVLILDDLGNQETLKEQAPGGVYLTNANGLRGVVGHKYQLTIKTQSGKKYESDREVLPAAPPILNLYYQYTKEPDGLNLAKKQGWNVYLDTKDPDTLGNYYKWNWTNYEFITVCSKRESASGVITGLGCCSNCWDITRCYTCVNINSDANINGKAISRQFISRVPYKSTSPYYLEIQQQAISAGAYTFWKSVRQLTENTGGLFDAAPSIVRGNIHCTSDPAEMVYGYFGATGISEHSITIDRSAGEGYPDADPPVTAFQPIGCAACENNLYRTPNKPRWW
ncbi:DUF4249 domain-containing protein [Spirosoma sp.]|uniref:DUF4249 domain-containing protein n=1 Tax=Spirosoma sp. TaxID=1899569 RepID=UPI0026106EC9|nr:DUF4249 domain-containing protein [Spirosoma sp.]MCX6215574.1 DUF4249 domain-containing protein [Spirosoma sp.]